MIKAPTFPDDHDSVLMSVQHDLWFNTRGTSFEIDGWCMGTCFYIFYRARQAILFYTDSNPLFFPERDNLHNIYGFDHRVLQGAHDLIASFYRWCFSAVKRPVFSKNLNTYRSYVLAAWKTYLHYEVGEITWGRLDIAEQILRAVVFQNTNEGYTAENYLLFELDKRYGPEFRDDRNRLSG